jgi:hypothetical protein
MITVEEFRFTFGQKYYEESHPCEYAHPNGFITVVAKDEMAARAYFIKRFGETYCSIFTPKRMEELCLPYDYWPKGELHRYIIGSTSQETGIEMTEHEIQMTAYQLAVLHNDGTTFYYSAVVGWKIDSSNQTLVIGRGLERHIIPLMNIRDISFISQTSSPSEKNTDKTTGY